MVLDTGYYAFLGVGAFVALSWTLLSMGIIKPRDRDLYLEKEKHLDNAKHSIEETFRIMESIPAVNRDNIRDHLEKGEFYRALEVA